MITLTRETLAPETITQDRHVWPLRITAVSTDEQDLSSKIFVYQSKASGGLDKFVGDVFSVVASVLQMEELPEDAIADGEESGLGATYYRLSTCEFVARSEAHAESVWQKIHEDVQDLVRNHKAAKVMTVQETVVVS